jgi:hypothetical protein
MIIPLKTKWARWSTKRHSRNCATRCNKRRLSSSPLLLTTFLFRPDQVIQHNYVVQYIEQYQSVLQQAIIETLKEIDAEASNLFLEKIAEKMSTLKVPELNPPNEKKILQEVQTLSAKLITNGTNP